MLILDRQMVALRPMTYLGARIERGDSFAATGVDADYLTRCGAARDDTAPPPAEPLQPTSAPFDDRDEDQSEPALHEQQREQYPLAPRRGRHSGRSASAQSRGAA